jgi:hypothetical protein
MITAPERASQLDAAIICILCVNQHGRKNVPAPMIGLRVGVLIKRNF